MLNAIRRWLSGGDIREVRLEITNELNLGDDSTPGSLIRLTQTIYLTNPVNMADMEEIAKAANSTAKEMLNQIESVLKGETNIEEMTEAVNSISKETLNQIEHILKGETDNERK